MMFQVLTTTSLLALTVLTPTSSLNCTDRAEVRKAYFTCFETQALYDGTEGFKEFFHLCDQRDKVLEAHDCAFNTLEFCPKGSFGWRWITVDRTNKEMEAMMVKVCDDPKVDYRCVDKVLGALTKENFQACLSLEIPGINDPKFHAECRNIIAVTRCFMKWVRDFCDHHTSQIVEMVHKKTEERICDTEFFG